MHARPACSLAPLPTLDEFAEAVADRADARSVPTRLQAVIRVLAEATRASLSGRNFDAQADAESTPIPGPAAG